MSHGPVIHIISSTQWSGRDQYALDICCALRDKGEHITVYTGGTSGVDAPFLRSTLRVRHLPLGRYAGISTVLSICSVIRRYPRPPVIHVHSKRDAFLALAARRLCGRSHTRVVYTHHTLEAGEDGALNRRLLRNLHALIFPSELCRNTFLSTWNPLELPLSEERIHTLHNSAYIPGAPLPLPSAGPIVFSYFGRIANGKGIETLIQALPSLRGLRGRACIAGPGHPDYVDTLKRMASRLQVMDMIDWRATDTDRDSIVERSHIGVSPSLEPESFGMSGAAYMACGRPQITTHNGAQCEYLTHGRDALLIPPGSVGALTDALQKLLTDPSLRTQMGTEALSSFSHSLSWEHFYTSLCHLYFDP